MELDAADPAPEPPRNSGALPVLFAEALPPGLHLLVERLEEHAGAARGAFADNTIRALAADSRIFSAWCAHVSRTMLPATPETIAAFIDAQAETKSRATVERYRSLIAALHRAAGLANPCVDEIVRLAIKRNEPSQGPAAEAGRAAQPDQHSSECWRRRRPDGCTGASWRARPRPR